MASPQGQIRVLMAVPQYPFPVVGGLEKQAHELARELVRQGLHVQVLSGRVVPDQPDVEDVDGVIVHRLPWPRSRQARWLAMPFLMWRQFARLRREVDVVHCHVFSGFGLFLILLAKHARVPILVKLASVGHGSLPFLTLGLIGRLRGAVFRLSDAVVAMSQQSLDELAAFGFDRQRVLATPNGIRLQQPQARKRSLDAPLRLVFVGRLHPDKGLHDLVGALRLVEQRRHRRAWSLDVIGDGEHMAMLEKWIDDAGLTEKVRLLGHRDRITDLMWQYDALLLPSYREGNSNVILEAMAAGLAVVSTSVGGTPMLLGPAGRDWLHQPGDTEALAKLVTRLIEEPEGVQALGRNLRQRVEKHFEIGVVASTYAAAYRQLAQGKRYELASLSNPIVTGSTAPLAPEHRGRSE